MSKERTFSTQNVFWKGELTLMYCFILPLQQQKVTMRINSLGGMIFVTTSLLLVGRCELWLERSICARLKNELSHWKLNMRKPVETSRPSLMIRLDETKSLSHREILEW